jgi:hypothetical protein
MNCVHCYQASIAHFPRRKRLCRIALLLISVCLQPHCAFGDMSTATLIQNYVQVQIGSSIKLSSSVSVPTSDIKAVVLALTNSKYEIVVSGIVSTAGTKSLLTSYFKALASKVPGVATNAIAVSDSGVTVTPTKNVGAAAKTPTATSPSKSSPILTAKSTAADVETSLVNYVGNASVTVTVQQVSTTHALKGFLAILSSATKLTEEDDLRAVHHASLLTSNMPPGTKLTVIDSIQTVKISALANEITAAVNDSRIGAVVEADPAAIGKFDVQLQAKPNSPVPQPIAESALSAANGVAHTIANVIPISPSDTSVENDLAHLYKLIVTDPNVTVTPIPDPTKAGSYFIDLSSSVPLSTEEQNSADQEANSIKEQNISQIINGFPPSLPIVRTYTVRFLRDSLPAGADSSASASSDDISGTGVDQSANHLATVLTGIYPGTTVTAQENKLILKGDATNVRRLRELTALTLDVPSPEVRADVYTIQVNSTPSNRRECDDKIDEIEQGIQIVKDYIHLTELGLGQYLGNPQSSSYPGLAMLSLGNKTIGRDLDQAGFSPNPVRPLGVNEMLVFMALANPKALRAQLLRSAGTTASSTLVDQLLNSLENAEDQIKNPKNRPTATTIKGDQPPSDSSLLALLQKIQDQILLTGKSDVPGAHYLLNRTGHLLIPANNLALADNLNDTKPSCGVINGVGSFLESWNECEADFEQPGDAASADDALPDAVSQSSADTDILLKGAMDALTEDLNQLYVQPLLDWIRIVARSGHGSSSGINLVGETELLVRDRTVGSTTGQAQSFVKFTPIPEFDSTLLTGAKTLANGTAGTADTTSTYVPKDAKGPVTAADGSILTLPLEQTVQINPATGLAYRNPDGSPVITTGQSPNTQSASQLATTALGALTPLQALGLNALLAANSDPLYRSIAPGTSLSIRPFVVDDDGSARVQLNLTSTVNAQQPADLTQAAKQGVPINEITSQTVSTEATISAFDLETVASFGVQSTAPGDYAWRVPILDDLPVVGSLFHGPIQSQTDRQDSIEILSLTILPRSLDLVPYLNEQIK